MNKKKYYISEASRLVGVESHVLRYWEEQLDLPICRNEMGHRYYEEEDILLMQHIRQVMEKGVQLRAVKMMLPGLLEHREDVLAELLRSVEEQKDEPGDGAGKTPREDNGHGSPVEMPVSFPQEMPEYGGHDGRGSMEFPSAPDPGKELRMMQFQDIMAGLIGQALRQNNPELAATTTELVSEKVIKEMDYLMRLREVQEEERYKKLDETIRTLQKTRKKLGSRKKKS